MDTQLKSISKLGENVNKSIDREVEEGLQHEVENIFGYWHDRPFIVIPIWESIVSSTKRKIFYSDSRK